MFARFISNEGRCINLDKKKKKKGVRFAYASWGLLFCIHPGLLGGTKTTSILTKKSNHF